MKKKFSNKQLLAINVPIMSFLAILMVAVIVLSVIFSDTISLFLYGIGGGINEKTLNAGTELCEDIVEEGTVLLKNEQDTSGASALPLSEDEISKVNVFGWAAYDWMTSAFGSGFSNTSLKKIKFFPALQEAGIEYNTTLYNMYKNFYSNPVNSWGMELAEYRGDIKVGTDDKFILHEPGAAYYTNAVIEEAREFSSVALVVIGRTGGEAADLRFSQEKQVQTNGSKNTTTVTDRHYLELSTEEEEMIAAAKSACDKVIVLLNTSNTMETGFLDDDGIDAALLVGLTGLTGVRSVIDVLCGYKEVVDEDGNVDTAVVSPSGRTADTYAYDIMSAPSSVNSGYGGSLKYTGLSTSSSYKKSYYDAYIDYHEGIYVGYRYYETAAEEGYINYKQTVQYPFGYGLSYTSFEWNVEEILINEDEQNYKTKNVLGKNDKITMTVSVKNTGAVAGKDVVQLYYTAPYEDGGIEKSHVVLGAFAKTPVIEPNESKKVKLELSVQSMASYDHSDANGKNGTGYELDGGDYVLRLMKNSHDAAAIGEGSKTQADIVYSIPANGYDYDTDEVTGKDVENRFTGNDTIDNADLDGSEEQTPVTYMTRANFAGTFPKNKIVRGRTAAAYEVASATAPTAAQLSATGYGNIEDPFYGAGGTLTIEDMFDAEGYDDEYWDLLIEQMSTAELFELIRNGYFKTAAINSIDKPQYVDLDGPLGLNTRVTSNTSCSFVFYPSETILAQTWNVDLAYAMGLSVGTEARESEAAIRGWYGPAANIHRNPLGGRNGEYYSEDALLSGKMCAEVVRGAKNMGLYCYVKHFVANESESLREGLYTFMTEQTLREIYLRPFEITVKEGGGNALMTSMNRLGRVWVGASRGLLTDIVRGEWNFQGSTVTDWVDTGSTYMPAYKGIWAGNSIWLNNSDANQLFANGDYENNKVFITLAQRVARDVLWTLIDTENARLSYDPTAESGLGDGFEYNRTWYIYVALIEIALAAGIGVLAFFLIKNIRKNNQAKAEGVTAEETVTNEK